MQKMASNESDLKARKKLTSREEASIPLESLVGSQAYKHLKFSILSGRPNTPLTLFSNLLSS